MRNWAIVCGAIRSLPEFRITINAIMALRSQGLLEGIVVATWNDVFRKNRQLKQELIRRGILLVELPSLREGGNGQTFRQHRLFEAGMRHCPDGVAVLKFRTDKALHRLHYFVHRLRTGPDPAPPGHSPFRLMQARISVQAVSASMPFNHSDIVFYGLKQDLARLSHLDQIYDWAFYPGSMNAETRWFSYPFIRKLNFFRQFFEFLNCRTISQFVIDKAQARDFDAIPDIVMDALAANILCIHHNFEIVSPDPADATPPSLRQLLGFGAGASAKIVPMTMTSHAVCYSNRVIAAFAQGRFAAEDGGERLRAAFARLEDPAYLARTIQLNEIKEIWQSYFPDTAMDNRGQSVLRLATNVSAMPDSLLDEPLDIDLDLGGADSGGDGNGDGPSAAEQAFVQRFIMDNAVHTDLATLYFQLAEKYRTGTEVRPSETRAQHWLFLAAEGRYRPAETAWADVLKDRGAFDAAAQWYRKAALRGDPAAQKALALLLRDRQINSVEDSWESWMEISRNQAGTPELPA